MSDTKLVPVEATEEMIEAAYEAASIDDHWEIQDGDDWAKSFKAALAAAPSPWRPEHIEYLIEAVGQALDDMSRDSYAVCGATKAMLRVAYEPFMLAEERETDVSAYPLEEAMGVLDEVGLLPSHLPPSPSPAPEGRPSPSANDGGVDGQ